MHRRRKNHQIRSILTKNRSISTNDWAYIEPQSNTKFLNLWLNQAQNHFKLYVWLFFRTSRSKSSSKNTLFARLAKILFLSKIEIFLDAS